MVDHHNGTPYEQPLAKMRDWQVRNMSGLGHLAKLLTTTANASTHLLMVQLSMNETEDESKVFKIESVSSMEIDLVDRMQVTSGTSSISIKSQCEEIARNASEPSQPSDVFNILFSCHNLSQPTEKGTLLNLNCVRVPKVVQPKHNSVEYYVHAINAGAGGLLSLE